MEDERADAQRTITVALPSTGDSTPLVLTMTDDSVQVLAEEIEDRLVELGGEPADCRHCGGTGDLWLPVAPGAVVRTSCDCRAARQRHPAD